jgi:hypothetical protein
MTKKRALLIGVATGPNLAPLDSVVPNLELVRARLVAHGSAEPCELLNGTKAAIEAAVRQAVADTEPGECLAVYFAGHGTQVRDPSSSEENPEFTEGVCPNDFAPKDANSVILESELLGWLVKPGVHFTLALECCCAGGIAPEQQGERLALETRLIAERLLRPIVPGVARPLRAGRVPAAPPIAKLRPPPGAHVRRFFRETQRFEGVILAATAGVQRADEDLFMPENMWKGLFTKYFCDALDTGEVDLVKLIDATRASIGTHCTSSGLGCEQVPQLYSSSGVSPDFYSA